MADSLEDDRPPLAEMLADRRRSGRRDYENAHLIALLRHQPAITNPATAEVDTVPKMLSVDDLSSAPNRTAHCGRHAGGGDFCHLIMYVMSVAICPMIDHLQ